MNKKSFLLLLLIPFLFYQATCKNKKTKTPKATTTQASTSPAWLQAMIKEMEAEKPHQLKSSVTEYLYQNKKVYYIPADCCDQLDPLYDEKGNVICHPSGGFTGKGDGKCPDFDTRNQKGKLIWHDVRQDGDK